MSWQQFVVEVLGLVLSGPVVFSALAVFVAIYFNRQVVALFSAVADRMASAKQGSIKIPGGGEVSFTQGQELGANSHNVPDIPEPDVASEGLSTEQLEQQLRSERANSYLWEYRYLNYFLVYGTQLVLDWLAGLESPATVRHFHNFWFHLIPKEHERNVILEALQAHHLVEVSSDLIQVTPKGHEYKEWRGQLPNPAA